MRTFSLYRFETFDLANDCLDNFHEDLVSGLTPSVFVVRFNFKDLNSRNVYMQLKVIVINSSLILLLCDRPVAGPGPFANFVATSAKLFFKRLKLLKACNAFTLLMGLQDFRFYKFSVNYF